MRDFDVSQMTPEDAAVMSLRRCGHYLHHSAGKDSEITNSQLMQALTEDEMKQLTELLGKCLEAWQK